VSGLEPPRLLVGLDLIEIERVERALERHPERFRARCFTAREVAELDRKPRPSESYAGRFAAKEAVAKAFGTGIGAELGWRSVEVVHGERGEPLVRLDTKGEALLAARGASGVMLTLSHTDSMAMAVAALVKAG